MLATNAYRCFCQLMLDYQNKLAGIEDMRPWSSYIKERCSVNRKRGFNKEK